ANHVRDGYVRRRELFHVAMFTGDPADRRFVALGGEALAAGAAERLVGIVVDLASCDDGNLGVHESYEAAKDARFRLSTQPEQNEVVPRENRVDDLRDHGVVVAVQSREDRFALLHLAEQVFAQFLPHRALRDSLLRPLTSPKLSQILWQCTHRITVCYEKSCDAPLLRR